MLKYVRSTMASVSEQPVDSVLTVLMVGVLKCVLDAGVPCRACGSDGDGWRAAEAEAKQQPRGAARMAKRPEPSRAAQPAARAHCERLILGGHFLTYLVFSFN